MQHNRTIFQPAALARLSVLDAFNANAKDRGENAHSIAAKLERFAFANVLDKYSQESLLNHTRAVRRRTVEIYKGRVSNQRLAHLVSLARLHEILEIKDNNGRPVWTFEDLAYVGLPLDMCLDLHALARGKEAYLDYGQRVAQRPDAALVKIADCEVNMSPDRGAYDARSVKQSFLDKKNILYPAMCLYQHAVSTGQIDPRTTTIPAFIMQDPYVPVSLKNAGKLAEYSSDVMAYNPRRASTVSRFVRDVRSRVASIAGYRPALAI